MTDDTRAAQQDDDSVIVVGPDGRHVVLSGEAAGMAAKVAAAGYTPVPVELSELKKGGGSVKCCVAELRS